MRRVTLLALGLFATPLFAQYWAFPAKTPNTDVTCTTCADKAKGQLTPGYPAALGTYVGRYLDSSASSDCQQLVRTFRAATVLPMPALNPPHGRMYFQIGSAVMAWSIDHFFQEVAAGNGFQYNSRAKCNTQIADEVLPYDAWFYAEDPGSGWDVSSGGDGQTRLYYIDADDQGYVYLATKWYRWGIVKDDMAPGGGSLSFVAQPDGTSDDVVPALVLVLKGSNGAYYAVIGDAVNAKLNVFDVTNRELPQRRANLTKSIYRYAKNSAMNVVGIATADGRFEIYTADALVANGTPLVSDAGAGDGAVRGVGSDGTNFYVASDAASGLVISTYAADGRGGYHKVKDFRTSRPTYATENLKWGDGYLVQSGITDGSYELRLFKAPSVNDVSEVDLSIPKAPGTSITPYYFKNYYHDNTSGRSGYVGAGLFGQFHDSQVVKSGGHTYLVVTAFGLGDVYELQGSDSIGIRNDGSVGTPNPNRSAGGAAGPFYGDPIGFTASTSAAAQTNITWDFGNADAAPGADPNVISGVTAQQTSHRYSGLTSATQLPTTRTVTATSVSNSAVTGALAVTLAKPSVAVGLAGVSGAVTQASQLAALPIVAGDRFVDASDGSVQSHFDTWSIDGGAASALPSESVAAGACAASHTLSFDAHYGPYTGTSPSLRSLSDLPIGIHAAAYSVRPFAASVATAPSSGSITFTAAARTTSDTTILTAAQAAALQYRWQLVDAAGNVLVTGPSGAGAVPAFTAQKSAFTSRGIRARLTLTSPTAVGGACAGLNMESVDAYTQPLNGPDPVLNGDCTAGGPPCSFSVSSASGVDRTADGWTYSWNIVPASYRGTPNGDTFAPTFIAVGQYTVSVTVANAIGSTTASKNVTVTTTPRVCPKMLPGNNVFISYQSASGSCSFVGGTCNANEPITFVASSFNYDFSCDTHTFTWDFGDGAHGSGQTLNHSFAASGTYTVSLTITNASESVTTTANVVVTGIDRGCPPMVAGTNVFPAFSAPSGCTSDNTKPCTIAESINFAAGAAGYDFSCKPHTFTWDFGDGKTATTTSISTPHAFAAAQTYNVSLTISNSTQTVKMTVPVRVAAHKDCPPLGASSFFVAYNGPKSQCTYIGDTTCSNLEAVAFQAAPSLGLDLSCFTALTYQWDFGDGSDKVTTANAAHTYAGAGKYNVSLTVSDGVATVTYTATVKVRDEHDALLNCVFDFTVDGRVVNGVALPDEFVFTVSGQNGATAPSYEWDFGDGTKVTSGAAQQTHAYADAKPYTVTLTVPGTNCHVQHVAVKSRRRAAGR
jgi:PKD repeat protein